MKHKIAVEHVLTPVKDYLSNKGFQVETVNVNKDLSKITGNYDAFIVTGLNLDLMGIQDTETKAVFVNADGLTAEQVYKELESRLI